MHSTAPLGREATLEDLWNLDEPAELIDGEIIPVTPVPYRPGRAALLIWRSLEEHARLHGGGHAIADPTQHVLPGERPQVVIPDASWWIGAPREDEMLPGAPALAVEVRSKNGYGPAAERKITRKRSLYFAAGTQVVWDVDVLREAVIRAYRAADPERPAVFRRGEVADAEPAVPGWRFPVDEMFE